MFVSVPYCSSDGHFGNAYDDLVGFRFFGHEIIKAVIGSLTKDFFEGALDLVVFGGASAGARGAMVHIDYVSRLLKDAGVKKVVGVLDSPLWVDKDPIGFDGGKPTYGLLNQTRDVYNIAGIGVSSGKDVIPDDCREKYVGEEYKCLFGVFRMPFVQTEYLLISAQFDSYQLGIDGLALPFSEAQNSFADDFGGKMQDAFDELVGTKGATLYSLPCFNHAISESGAFFSLKTRGDAGLSEDEAVAAFLSNTSAFADYRDFCADGFDNCTIAGSKCGDNLWLNL